MEEWFIAEKNKNNKLEIRAGKTAFFTTFAHQFISQKENVSDSVERTSLALEDFCKIYHT